MRKKQKEAADLPPLSAEDRAYLDAVIADPDSDALRLAYAAHLRAKGDPRGELILGRIRSLSLRGIEGGKLLKILAKSLESSSLRSFGLGWKGLDEEGAKRLGESAVFAGLERLNLTGSRLTDAALLALIEAKPSFRLKALYMTRCSITSAGMIALLSSPIAERLSILCVNQDKGIADDAFVALARSKSATHLTFLEARRTGLGEEGARALAESPYLTSLASLRIARTLVAISGGEGLSLLKKRWGSKVVLGITEPDY